MISFDLKLLRFAVGNPGFSFGHQLLIVLNVCVMDETLQCDLPWAISGCKARRCNPTIYACQPKSQFD